MPIPLRCVCGAFLEIDDKFRGQKIPCPDCNRLLDTTPPPPPPSSTCGWAVASLVASLAGMLTLVGPVFGVLCGLIALRRIRRDPKLGGAEFAQTGVVLGGAFTLLSVWILLGFEFFGLDGFVRVYTASKELKPTNGPVVSVSLLNHDRDKATLKLPGSGWGLMPLRDTEKGDILALANPWEDSHIVCFSLMFDKEDDVRSRAIQRFLDTELVKKVSGGKDSVPAFPEPGQIKEIEEDKDSDHHVFQAEVKLGAMARVFLFRVGKTRAFPFVAVAGTRKSRFAPLEQSFRSILDSFTIVQGE